MDAIGSLAGVFNEYICGVIDDVVVVPQTPDEGIAAFASVEGVIGGVACDRIRNGISGAGCHSSREDERFDIVGERVGRDCCDHGVGARSRRLPDLIVCVVHKIGVVASASGHRVNARATI